MSITAVVLIGALISTLLDLAKYVQSKNWNATITVLVGFAIGTAVVFLASAAQVTSGWVFNGYKLNDLDTGSKVILGLLATSIFAKIHDLSGAINQGSNPSALVAKLTRK